MEFYHNIESISKDQKIKYLGVTFIDEIVLDTNIIMKNFQEKLRHLVSSPLLNADQKLNIINFSIWPSLIYTFQSTPIEKIPKLFLKDIDLSMKSSLKEILDLPHDTPDNMIYSSPSVKGLGLFRATWEAYIQRQLLYINHCK